MSVEELEMGGGSDFKEPEHLLPHEAMYQQSQQTQQASSTPEPTDQNIDITEPGPQDSVPDFSDNKWIEVGEDGQINVDVPENPEEFEEFYNSLPEEMRKEFNASFGENEDDIDKEIDPEAAQSQGNEGEGDSPEGQEELTHEISQEVYDALPDEAKTYLDDVKSRLVALAQYETEEYKEGFENFMNDPVIALRYKQLSGEVTDDGQSVLEKHLSQESIAGMKLDFDFDPKGSAERLQTTFQNAVRDAESRIHDYYKSQNEVKEYEVKMREEFRKIEDAIPDMKNGDVDYTDEAHPLNPMLKWLAENEKNINLVNIGGVDTYKLYLSKMGKPVPDITKTVHKQVVRNIARATSNHARTLPKTMKTESQGGRDLVHGVDVDKFRSDENYADQIWQQHGENPQMRKFLSGLTFGE